MDYNEHQTAMLSHLASTVDESPDKASTEGTAALKALIFSASSAMVMLIDDPEKLVVAIDSFCSDLKNNTIELHTHVKKALSEHRGQC